MHRIVDITVLPGYRLRLTFEDGTKGVVDLSNRVGKGVFGPLKDESVFGDVRIGPSGGLSWGESVDLCPDALFLEVTGTAPDEVFPALKGERSRA